jgi:cytochrome c oxidase subunit 3
MKAAVLNLPKESSASRVNATLGMIFFIGSWTMAFGSLFLCFLVLRQRIGVWPPEGIALPSFPMACAATVLLLASSAALHLAIKRAGRPSFQKLWLLGATLGGGFAALQYWLWIDLMAAGRLPQSGLYESLFYGLTWFHGVHVVIGLLSLLWASVGLKTGRYGSHSFSTVSNIAIFWHFVDVVWVVLFLGFFVF